MTHRVLILCTGNCVRSQMAEGLLRHLSGADYEVHSAGSHPNGYVSPLAIEAMREIGMDISAHRSKSVSEFASQPFDTVITVCDSAAEECPVFPGAPRRSNRLSGRKTRRVPPHPRRPCRSPARIPFLSLRRRKLLNAHCLRLLTLLPRPFFGVTIAEPLR
jgi:protein-tyrosine-phosphatase